MKAVVGTKNKAKIRGVEKAFSLLNIDEIVSINVEEYEKQPMGLEETFIGASLRALKAFKNLEGEGFGVGVEAGVLSLADYLLSGQVVVVTDGSKYSVGLSSYFPLPNTIYNDLRRGVELGVLMNRISGVENMASSIGAIGYLSKGYMTRVDLTYQATLAAITPWLNKELYPKLPTIDKLIELLKRYISDN